MYVKHQKSKLNQTTTIKYLIQHTSAVSENMELELYTGYIWELKSNDKEKDNEVHPYLNLH